MHTTWKGSTPIRKRARRFIARRGGGCHALERFFAYHGKNENLNLYLLDRVSNIIYHNGIGKRLSALCITGKTI